MIVTVRLTAITRQRNHTHQAHFGGSRPGVPPGTGRIRGATLISVNGSRISHSARDGDPDVSPPQEYPSSSGGGIASSATEYGSESVPGSFVGRSRHSSRSLGR